jgi:hypothetical protein
MAIDVALAIGPLSVRVLYHVFAQQGKGNEMKVYQVCPVCRFASAANDWSLVEVTRADP